MRIHKSVVCVKLHNVCEKGIDVRYEIKCGVRYKSVV